MNNRILRTPPAVLAIAFLWPAAALGHGEIPQDAPVERIVENLAKYAADHPDDPEGYYRLARAHTLALETKTGFVRAFVRRDPPKPAEGSWAKPDEGGEPKPMTSTEEQFRTHLTEAIRNLNKAIAMRPVEARYRLTLACALEAGEPFMNSVDVWPLCPVPAALAPSELDSKFTIEYVRGLFQEMPQNPRSIEALFDRLREDNWTDSSRHTIMQLAYDHRDKPELKEHAGKLRQFDWHEQIEEQYFGAMCYALPHNGKATEKPVWGGMEDWVSYEAAKDFIRVVETRKPRPSDKIRIKVAKATIKAFDDLPKPNAVTPILIDFAGRGLHGLTSFGASSTFDLDGTARPRSWSWVTPDAGILVWDPAATGRITSGRQLFGSATWWVMFDHGYQALDTLDDNRDGQLTEHELRGLAVWFDKDGNGRSDKAEVRPVETLGIAAISCRATGVEGASPVNPTGVQMTDGREVASYDWIAQAIDAK
jgi:hypothetical protein